MALSPAMRAYQREYAYQRRWKAWAKEAEALTRCPRMLSRGLVCREPLQNRKGVPFCARCDCKARGICVDCRKAPVVGAVRKALRCKVCRKLAILASCDRWKDRNPAKVKAKWVERKATMTPQERAERIEKGRLWRIANPTRKRRYAKAWNRSENCRAYMREYRAKWSEQRRERERERARLRAQGIVMTHPCTDCQTPLTGRPKKCEPCRKAAIAAARSALFSPSSRVA